MTVESVKCTKGFSLSAIEDVALLFGIYISAGKKNRKKGTFTSEGANSVFLFDGHIKACRTVPFRLQYTGV